MIIGHTDVVHIFIPWHHHQQLAHQHGTPKIKAPLTTRYHQQGANEAPTTTGLYQHGFTNAMLLVVSHLGAPPSGRVCCEANYTAGGSEALSPNH